MRDLIIAGGGPVGLVTALYAARAGLEVTVREPRSGVLDKACGEGLMPGAVARLRDLGVNPVGHRIEGIRYVDGPHVAQARFRGAEGLGVRRTTLHSELRSAVDAAGVVVVGPAVREVTDQGDHLLVDGEATRYLIAADGLHSPVRRLTGLDVPATGRRRYGQRAHVALTPWTPFVEVHWSAVGEAYVTPVAQDEVGVAVLTSRRCSFTELLEHFPVLCERLEGQDLSAVRGAGPLRQRARSRRAGRVLLVGDAAGYVDALTGEGIALGVAQAAAAVDAVRAGAPERYDAAARSLVRRHELLTKGLVNVTRVPMLRRRIVAAAQYVPGVFPLAVNTLARPA